MKRKGLTFPESAISKGCVGTARIRAQIGATAVALESTGPVPLTAPLVAMAAKKPSKYRNEKCVVDGIKFDSRKEARRWQQLVLMRDAGEITDLERQVVYVLAPAVRINGRLAPPLRYIADFVYERGDKTIVEDVKGMITPEYRIKRHLMAVKGLSIVEIK
ncbi:DUF1064 domain-containing protein [Pandoraea sp. PE-S2R-1]|uniref:DUF1064 domain-containing protein n=1 Tax=Pandoraea sp. PE-S2R-1 TaxID=1986994 RepID=UPI00201627EB|nr:DUF1064 domain-containing protein [Pandoraea sp. PE-S2R-1]